MTHAGLSTVTAALAGGVPLVCIPQGRDQPANAARVAACGVGRALAKEASSQEIAVAIADVLADDDMRRVARRFANAMDDLGHGAVATDAVEALADGHGAARISGPEG